MDSKCILGGIFANDSQITCDLNYELDARGVYIRVFYKVLAEN